MAARRAAGRTWQMQVRPAAEAGKEAMAWKEMKVFVSDSTQDPEHFFESDTARYQSWTADRRMRNRNDTLGTMRKEPLGLFGGAKAGRVQAVFHQSPSRFASSNTTVKINTKDATGKPLTWTISATSLDLPDPIKDPE